MQGETKSRRFITPILGLKGRGRPQAVNCQPFDYAHSKLSTEKARSTLTDRVVDCARPRTLPPDRPKQSTVEAVTPAGEEHLA
ncbi:hypothetical protein QT974_31965 [Microcoleus sp. herbarium12]